LGEHIRSRDSYLPEGSKHVQALEAIFSSFERCLANYALSTPSQDTTLCQGLRDGFIDMPALITTAVNKVLLSTDATIVNRRALDSDGNYRRIWRPASSVRKPSSKAATAAAKVKVGKKAGRAGMPGASKTDRDTRELYEKQYNTLSSRAKNATRKSTNRGGEDGLSIWLGKRKKNEKKGAYHRMITHILPHHPDGEEDDDDKRVIAEQGLLEASAVAAVASGKSQASPLSPERESSRVGTRYQAQVRILLYYCSSFFSCS
jgi:hypothetical protein